MGNVIIGAAVAGIALFVVKKLIRDKKNGKSCCGDCSRCGGC